jgi:hypothetical protein
MASPRKTISKMDLEHAVDEKLTANGFFEGVHARRTVFMFYISYLWSVDPTPKYPQAIKWHVMQGCVWPAVVAARTGLTTKSVERANAWLESMGLIKITKGISRHGGKAGPVDIKITLPLADGKQLGNKTEAKMVDEYWRSLEVASPTDNMSVGNAPILVADEFPTDMVSTPTDIMSSPTDMVSRPTDKVSDIKGIPKERAKENLNAPVRSLALPHAETAEAATSPPGEGVSTDSVTQPVAILPSDNESHSGSGELGDESPYAAPDPEVTIYASKAGVWAETSTGDLRQVQDSQRRRKGYMPGETTWDGSNHYGRYIGIIEGGYVKYIRNKNTHEIRKGRPGTRLTNNEELGYYDETGSWKTADAGTQWRTVRNTA